VHNCLSIVVENLNDNNTTLPHFMNLQEPNALALGCCGNTKAKQVFKSCYCKTKQETKPFSLSTVQ
jgi:hypothetical protein